MARQRQRFQGWRGILIGGLGFFAVWLLSFHVGFLPQPLAHASTVTAEGTEVFFADVLVRGQPVLQVGSLAEVSATERAAQINRRIAGVLQPSQPVETIEVNFDPARDLATLQLNNRVIMTVNAQDALDFNTSVEPLAQEWAQKLNAAMAQANLATDVAQRL
ncbi:MAG TPA: hypothetical protein V6D02_04930, partial [Candidatus Obscuribacterales bacterium]